MEARQIQKIINNIVSRESEIFDMVYFYGNKSRIQSILSEIENACTERFPTAKMLHIDANTFRDETMRMWRDRLMFTPQCDCDLYVFEGIEQIAGMQTTEQRLYGILDWLLENGHQVVVTGDRPTACIDRLTPRICAQLDGGVSFYISAV